ncbi:MAG: metallophosphoesterase [Anaerovoracaceae bacterium]|jgi:predicted phosphohydrolase
MSIFAIADLHLSLSGEKPMDIYGGEWVNHTEKIKNLWMETVTKEDTIILPGDNSWALKLEEAKEDLEWLSNLPGKKVMVKGNHDLWWNSISKLNKLHDSMYFLQNTFYEAENMAICGTRGWICPGDDDFTPHDEKIYKRELGRLKLSLEAAAAAGFAEPGEDGRSRIICALHYPPTNDRLMSSGFTDLFEAYRVQKVVYGHLHGKDAYKNGLMGMRNQVEYYLTSVDYLKCKPLKII